MPNDPIGRNRGNFETAPKTQGWGVGCLLVHTRRASHPLLKVTALDYWLNYSPLISVQNPNCRHELALSNRWLGFPTNRRLAKCVFMQLKLASSHTNIGQIRLDKLAEDLAGFQQAPPVDQPMAV